MEPFVVLSWDNTLQPFGVKPHRSGGLPGVSYEGMGQNTQSSSPKCLSWISKCCHPKLFQPISLSIVCFISCFPSAPFSFFEHLCSSASSSTTVFTKENPSFFSTVIYIFQFSFNIQSAQSPHERLPTLSLAYTINIDFMLQTLFRSLLSLASSPAVICKPKYQEVISCWEWWPSFSYANAY